MSPKSKLLIIDDTTINLDTLLTTLGDSYDVRVAISGEIGLKLINEKSFLPDLILLDIMMPEMDGYAVCRQLKANSKTQHIPIIFLTALNSADNEDKGLALGASDYITKPFNPAIVRRRVQIQLELKQHREQLQTLVDEKTLKLKKSNQEIVCKEAHLQSILRSAPVGIGLIVKQKLQWVNQRMEALVGYTNKELKGQHNRIFYQNEAEYSQAWSIKKINNDTEDAESVDTKLITKDGKLIDVCLSFTPLDRDNLDMGIIFTVLDITERNKLQAEHDRSNRLASIGVLAAGIAHEINNPNGLVLCNSAILTNVFNDLIKSLNIQTTVQNQPAFGGLSYNDLVNNVPEMLKETQAAAQRIKHIVAELRDFSRSDSSNDAAPVNINDVITSSIHLVKNEINTATDNFHLDLGNNLPLIAGVSTRLEQVMINLLLNATQALELKSQPISVSSHYSQKRNKVRIVIKDGGIGISPELLETITDPFVTTKLEQGGTGLGLSVSARIVKAHNGKLHFTSTLGSGTTAQVEFPASKG